MKMFALNQSSVVPLPRTMLFMMHSITLTELTELVYYDAKKRLLWTPREYYSNL